MRNLFLAITMCLCAACADDPAAPSARPLVAVGDVSISGQIGTYDVATGSTAIAPDFIANVAGWVQERSITHPRLVIATDRDDLASTELDHAGVLQLDVGLSEGMQLRAYIEDASTQARFLVTGLRIGGAGEIVPPVPPAQAALPQLPQCYCNADGSVCICCWPNTWPPDCF